MSQRNIVRFSKRVGGPAGGGRDAIGRGASSDLSGVSGKVSGVLSGVSGALSGVECGGSVFIKPRILRYIIILLLFVRYVIPVF